MKPLGDEVFNPLDKTNLAESVSDHLLKRLIVQLPPSRFSGAGIYAIYYAGKFPAYQQIAKTVSREEKAIPIYVGKAVPAGSRKGGYGLGSDPGEVLFRRLSEHASSIDSARNISLADFRCRYLLVDDIWIPLGESLLIEKFKPVWNICVDGFGHHDQGKARRGQMKSAWDTLHPGRSWAENVERPNTRSAEQISAEVVAYLDSTPK
ncbi:MAG: Eco29kI family restriction endonuclease [Candidatus Binataceae bacterium]